MVTYIYFVKCPNCEDEHFDFFDEAKEFALGCLSQKPIITQTEVNRNDFGECTDSADLGTVWSWEDMMGEDDYTEAEPTKSIFTKDDLKLMADGKDPEFGNLDNSLDCEVEESELAEASPADATRAPKDSDYVIVLKNPINSRHTFFGNNYRMTADLNKAMTYPGKFSAQDDIKYAADQSVQATNDPNDFYYEDNFFVTTVAEAKKLQGKYEDKLQHKARLAEDKKLKTWLCYYDNLDVGTVEAADRDEAMEKFADEYRDRYSFDHWDHYWDVEEVVEESCKKDRTPIPEGMTIEQLIEEMEENEDTVECTWCNDLFDKSECRKEVDLGWLCSRCEMAIKSRGETLTFREGNYWDFLDEDLQELSFSEMVADSINHLINDLGKDSSAENFADDVIKDIENNYDTEVPEDPEKYRDWASEIACEVSRQLNNQLGEELEVDELHDLGNEYDGGYPNETSEVSDSHLKLCPECGKETFDIETGICVDCGFN